MYMQCQKPHSPLMYKRILKRLRYQRDLICDFLFRLSACQQLHHLGLCILLMWNFRLIKLSDITETIIISIIFSDFFSDLLQICREITLFKSMIMLCYTYNSIDLIKDMAIPLPVYQCEMQVGRRCGVHPIAPKSAHLPLADQYS